MRRSGQLAETSHLRSRRSNGRTFWTRVHSLARIQPWEAGRSISTTGTCFQPAGGVASQSDQIVGCEFPTNGSLPSGSMIRTRPRWRYTSSRSTRKPARGFLVNRYPKRNWTKHNPELWAWVQGIAIDLGCPAAYGCTHPRASETRLVPGFC
jgi:hypothetical protein